MWAVIHTGVWHTRALQQALRHLVPSLGSTLTALTWLIHLKLNK